MKHEQEGAGRQQGEPTPQQADRAEQDQSLVAGEETRGVRQPEPIQVQPLVESADGNPLEDNRPEQQSKREKKLAYDSHYYQEHREEILEQSRRRYQHHRQEKLVYQGKYRKGHKKEIRIYQREYMRDYREGKRRRLQAEPQQSIQVFPTPATE